jgi:uncharacterized protein DUF6510
MAEDLTYLDGNALAGPLGEVFGLDLTVATSWCTGCGARAGVAQLRVYLCAPGLVARCPSCDQVILRLVRAPGRAYLDLRGNVCLEIPTPAEPGDG